MPPKTIRSTKTPLILPACFEATLAPTTPGKTRTKTQTTSLGSSIYSGGFLVIVESPSKTAKIESFLGSNYRVIASKGHITKLGGIKDIDIKQQFTPRFSVIDAKKSHIEFMRSVVAQYPPDHVILATDHDREGEAIGYHLCVQFGLPVETTPRILFNEITERAVRQAIAAPTVLDMDMIRSQQARQILDVLIGFKVSPLLWKYVYHSKSNALSAGRCQTPALRLVYDNYLEGRRHTEIQRRYKTTGYFFPPHALSCELDQDLESEEQVQDFLEQSKTHTHTFVLDAKRQSTKSPPKPLNTARLLQGASNALHLSPKQTMQLAQMLYQEGKITYMRTESTQYAQEFLEKAEKYVLDTFGGVNRDRRFLGDTSKIAHLSPDMPHEAIRVTNLYEDTLFVEVGGAGRDSRLESLYRYIWKTTVESCMSTAVYDAHKLRIQGPMDRTYTHVLEVPVFLGWKVVSERNSDECTTLAPGMLLYLQSSKTCNYHRIETSVVQSGGRSHYTESGLIQQLEERGIGRPSTYAMFLDTIVERGYVHKCDVPGTTETCHEYVLRGSTLETKTTEKTFGAEKNKLVIQPLGILCIEFLTLHFEELFAYSYTKTMEEALDHIAEGGTGAWYNICDQTLKDIGRMSRALTQLKKTVYRIDETHELTFQSSGPCVRKRVSDISGGYDYLPIQEGVELDLERAQRGEYTVEELVLYSSSYVGTHQDQAIHRRSGKYGPFLEWGDVTKSLKDWGGSLSDMTVDEAVAIFDTDETSGEGRANLKMLRVVNSDMSIRKGKFGPYLFYKTIQMAKPSFVDIKKFPHDCMTCHAEQLVAWMEKHKRQPSKRGSSKKK